MEERSTKKGNRKDRNCGNNKKGSSLGPVLSTAYNYLAFLAASSGAYGGYEAGQSLGLWLGHISEGVTRLNELLYKMGEIAFMYDGSLEKKLGKFKEQGLSEQQQAIVDKFSDFYSAYSSAKEQIESLRALIDGAYSSASRGLEGKVKAPTDKAFTGILDGIRGLIGKKAPSSYEKQNRDLALNIAGLYANLDRYSKAVAAELQKQHFDKKKIIGYMQKFNDTYTALTRQNKALEKLLKLKESQNKQYEALSSEIRQTHDLLEAHYSSQHKALANLPILGAVVGFVTIYYIATKLKGLFK